MSRHQGGLRWQGSDTSLKRSLRSCGRSNALGPRSAADASRARRRGDRMRPAYAACRVGSVIEVWRDTRAGAGGFRGVHVHLRLGQPLALRALRPRRYERRDRRRHALVALHHVVSWDFGHLCGGPRLEGMRLVAFPIGAFVVIVGTEEGVETLRRVQHVIVGAAGPLIVLVIFARRAELREFGVEFVIGLSWTRQ